MKDSKELRALYPAYPASLPLPLILDGATGTALMKRGMPQGACPEKWILENPGVMADIQRGYAAAGSGMVYSPTFGASRTGLRKHGMSEAEADEAAAALAAVSAEAVVGKALVFGDIGPSGVMLEPFGDFSVPALEEVFAAQAKAVDPYVSAYGIETMFSLSEALCALRAVRSVSPKPIFATVTVDKNGRTMSGDTAAAAFLALASAGACAVGCNCSSGPEEMCAVLKELAGYSLALGVPLIAKPNAGLPVDDGNGGKKYLLSGEDFAASAEKMLSEGVPILGGCCGTTEEHIAALAEKLAQTDFAALAAELAEKKKAAPDPELLICGTRTVTLLDADEAEAMKNGKTAPESLDGMDEDDLSELLSDYAGEDCAFLRVDTEEQSDLLTAAMPLSGVPLVLTGGSAADAAKRISGRTLVI